MNPKTMATKRSPPDFIKRPNAKEIVVTTLRASEKLMVAFAGEPLDCVNVGGGKTLFGGTDLKGAAWLVRELLGIVPEKGV